MDIADELAAAAATLAMSIDDDDEEDASPDSISPAVAAPEENGGEVTSMEIDKENLGENPATRDVEAAMQKVSIATIVPHSAH